MMQAAQVERRAVYTFRTVVRRAIGWSVFAVLPFALIILGWGLVADAQIYPPYLLPSPMTVLNDFYPLIFVNHSLIINLEDSLLKLAVGYVPGILGGLALGVVMGLNRTVARLCHGPIAFFNAIPSLAWIPIAILWLGIGYGAVVFIIFMSCFFPVLFNTVTGIRTIPYQYVSVARMCEASPLQTIRKVLIPGALPSIITGVRVGAAYGWRGMVGAEMVASSSGLGYMILNARVYLETDIVIVGIVTIGTCWLIIDRVVLSTLERSTVERWGMINQR